LLGAGASNLALLLAALVFLAPYTWIAASAFSADDVGSWPWPNGATLANFSTVWDGYDLSISLRTSFVVGCATMVVATLLAALAGYALSRSRSRNASGVTLGILLLQALPFGVTMVPMFDLARRLHLRNSYLGMTLVHAAITLPFLVWLMKDLFDAIPAQIEEAAAVDGASRFRALWQVLLPNAAAGLGVAGGYAFAFAWSEVMMALVLLDGGEMNTMALSFFHAAEGGANTGELSALSLLYLAPVVVVFALAGRLIVRGIATSMSGEQ
jgi:multiple sugar transport system permease protein